MELAALERRLAELRAQIAGAGPPPLSSAGFAVGVVRGDTGAIAAELGRAFRLQLLRREEAAIVARIEMIGRGNRLAGLGAFIARSDARAAEIERRIAEIERRHPILAMAENVPILQDLRGPWQELRALRGELAEVRQRRGRAAQARQAAQAALARSSAEYARRRDAIAEAAAPDAELRQAIERRRAALAQHWATRAWSAVRPMVGWALWIVLLLIAVPPAVKAFWFFVVAPRAARLRPIVVAGDVPGGGEWLRPSGDGGDPLPGSGVSRRVLLEPGRELLVKPDYLQSSMTDARIDSAAVLSWAIPLGSLATGMIGLTRIRVDRPLPATLSATGDMFDEVGIIDIPEGCGLVFKPSNLVGVIQPEDRPVRIRRLWRLGHASAWLTLQLRFLVFEGPCALVVKGARGVAIEPAREGRRIAGAATMGWSPDLRYSVRRSETFLAYLTGKQSLFNDGFEGEGRIVYEQMPRARARGGVLGRGLEGLGEGLLKVLGL
jgi:hypothetical protein